jgi:hypothetical protein
MIPVHDNLLKIYLRYGLHQNTPFSQVFGYNYFEKTLSKGKLGKSIRNEGKALETSSNSNVYNHTFFPLSLYATSASFCQSRSHFRTAFYLYM